MNIPPLTNLIDFLCTKKKYKCPICLETKERGVGHVVTDCNHDYCIKCYTTLSSFCGDDMSCPICRQEIIACKNEKNNKLKKFEQLESLLNILEEEKCDSEIEKIETVWKNGSGDKERVYHAFIFGKNISEDDSSTRSSSPILLMSEDEKIEKIRENYINLQKNISDAWNNLYKYRI